MILEQNYLHCASCAHVIIDGRCRCSHPKDEDWRGCAGSSYTSSDALESIATRVGLGAFASANDIPAVLEAKIVEAIAQGMSAERLENGRATLMQSQESPSDEDIYEGPYNEWCLSISGEFDRPHISEAFAAGYRAGYAQAIEARQGDSDV